MRKLVSLMHLSLDGMVCGAQGEMNWVKIDDEMYSEVEEAFTQVDTAMYGKVTYGMMKSYWPSVLANPASTGHSLKHAQWVDPLEKYIVSTSLTEPGWTNTHVISKEVEQQISQLKKKPGKDIMIFGSPRLTHSLMPTGLIDEYRLSINPIILGKGTSFFQNITQHIPLRLRYSKTLASGAMMVVYVKE